MKPSATRTLGKQPRRRDPSIGLPTDCRTEAVYMDPQHRLLLEHAVGAVQAESSALLTNAAVMVGITTGDFAGSATMLPLGNYSATGAFSSVAAGRCVTQCLNNKPSICKGDTGSFCY
jgi:acyl transferase domain-containing protein